MIYCTALTSDRRECSSVELLKRKMLNSNVIKIIKIKLQHFNNCHTSYILNNRKVLLLIHYF